MHLCGCIGFACWDHVLLAGRTLQGLCPCVAPLHLELLKPEVTETTLILQCGHPCIADATFFQRLRQHLDFVDMHLERTTQCNMLAKRLGVVHVDEASEIIDSSLFTMFALKPEAMLNLCGYDIEIAVDIVLE